jgi:hypothetical protein
MDANATPSKWSDLSGQIRQHWERLNDSDLSRIERDRSALPGVLQQRYGLTREAAEQQSTAFLRAHEQGAQGSPWENPKAVPSGQLAAGGAPGDAQKGNTSKSSGTPGSPQRGSTAAQSVGGGSVQSGGNSPRGGTTPSGNPAAGSAARPGNPTSPQGGTKATRPGSDADADVEEKRRTGETRATPAGGETDDGGDKDDEQAEGGGRSADADE